MRARLAIASAGLTVALREVVLRDKPADLLVVSPKGTVPVLVDGAQVIDESLQIMHWALARNDPEQWLDMPALGHQLIAQCDGPFKSALDRYKYANRHDSDPEVARDSAATFLRQLDTMLMAQPYLFGPVPRLADMACVTFVRQFAHVDLDWFMAQPWPALADWLVRFKTSDRFALIMHKYAPWSAGDPVVLFPH